MNLAKPGEIKRYCEPNALSTFEEYLRDYASPETRRTGARLIKTTLAGMSPRERKLAERLLAQVRNGKRDVYC